MENKIIQKAREYAKKKHKNQKDDSGLDYFETHICQVAKLVSLVTKDKEVIASAYLHDTLEDTDATLIELRELFGKKITNLVYELTHEGKKDHIGYYFPRLKSKDAILVKFADRLSNLSRMSSWNKKRQNHYLRKSVFWKGKSEKCI